MVQSKKNSNKKESIKKQKVDTHENDLYICMSDSVNKRKLLLTALKNSLIVQEEFEQISELRAEKKITLKEIKSNMDLINSKYQEVKKLLPNVKNVLSFTQKELNQLESQIDMLKTNMSAEEQILNDEIELEKKLKKTLESEKKVKAISEEEIKKITPTPKEVKELPKVKKHIPKKSVNKLDRIKNNLSLIEHKLKSL